MEVLYPGFPIDCLNTVSFRLLTFDQDYNCSVVPANYYFNLAPYSIRIWLSEQMRFTF